MDHGTSRPFLGTGLVSTSIAHDAHRMGKGKPQPRGRSLSLHPSRPASQVTPLILPTISFISDAIHHTSYILDHESYAICHIAKLPYMCVYTLYNTSRFMSYHVTSCKDGEVVWEQRCGDDAAASSGHLMGRSFGAPARNDVRWQCI